jgi:LemA protein
MMKRLTLFFMFILVAFATSDCKLLQQGADKYDTLVMKDETCMKAWGNIDVQLQRRADLIPNLVEVVKGYAQHEHDTLEAVQQARSAATQVKLEYKQGVDDFSDQQKMQQFQQAQSGLSQALGKLMMVQENYPNLKADAQFSNLMAEMAGTENRIAFARKQYNDAVGDYNVELRKVSGKVINPITGYEFKPRLYYGADESAKTAPKVSFTNPAPSASH